MSYLVRLFAMLVLGLALEAVRSVHLARFVIDAIDIHAIGV